MDTFELRAAFTATEGLAGIVRSLHEQEVAAVRGGRAPVRLGDTPHVVVSVIPLAAIRPETELEIDYRSAFHPLWMSGSPDFFHTLEGFVSAPAVEIPRAYALTARRGLIHYVFSASSSAKEALRLRYIERDIAKTVENSISKLGKFEIPGPFTVLVTLTGVSEVTADYDENHSIGRSRRPGREPLELPAVVMDEFSNTAIEPILRNLWFAFGIERDKGMTPGLCW